MTEDEKNNHDDDIHEYDGIKELNNKTPMWIVLLFLVTIGFSLLYVVHNFGYPTNGKNQTSEYDSAVAKANRELLVLQKSNAANSSKMNDSEKIEKGAQLYASKGCIACHGAMGEGNNIGPNLTDKVTIHGCSIENVITIITEGNPTKGMTAFKTAMSSDEINQVATFITQKLVGSNPANAKAAQGEACK